MDKQDKQKIKDLEDKIIEIDKQVESLEMIIREMNRGKREYTQKEIFENQIVFRNAVYDKSGTKVIN